MGKAISSHASQSLFHNGRRFEVVNEVLVVVAIVVVVAVVAVLVVLVVLVLVLVLITDSFAPLAWLSYLRLN